MMKYLFLMLFIPVVGYTQAVPKNIFNGEKRGDQLGRNACMSEDGSIIAIAIPFSDVPNDKSGQVQIFKDSAGAWMPMGQVIFGTPRNLRTGEIMDLSKDGKTLAIGNMPDYHSATVYRYAGGEWKEQIIIPASHRPDVESVRSVALSADGNTLAVGSEAMSTPYLQVYRFSNGAWDAGVQIKSEGSNENNGFGENISLSADGNRIAVGATGVVINEMRYVGQVRIYEFNSGLWTAVGSELNGKNSGEQFGYKVSLSANGKVVAISSSCGDMSKVNSGYVAVYENVSGDWKQIGTDIRPDKKNTWFGFSISLSSAGDVIGISMPYFQFGKPGTVSIFRRSANSWIKSGKDFSKEVSREKTDSPNNSTGWVISLAGNGKRIAVGYPHNDVHEDIAGQLVIYDVD